MKEGVISTPDVVCIAKESKHKKSEREGYVDFVTGKGKPDCDRKQPDRRSVRKDVEAACIFRIKRRSI